jgi:hypothetical protein
VLTGATKQTSLFGTAQEALTSQVLAFAGPAALGFAIKQTLDYADTLVKMSDRTGIGVVQLQRLESIASASGNSIDDLAGGINQFQKRISEGTIDAPIRRPWAYRLSSYGRWRLTRSSSPSRRRSKPFRTRPNRRARRSSCSGRAAPSCCPA